MDLFWEEDHSSKTIGSVLLNQPFQVPDIVQVHPGSNTPGFGVMPRLLERYTVSRFPPCRERKFQKDTRSHQPRVVDDE